MGSTRTTTRTIRIDNETAEYFAKKPLNRAVESLYGYLRAGEMSFDGDSLKIECTHQNEKKESKNGEVYTPKTEKVYTPDKNMAAINEMANLMRVEPEKLLLDIRELLESGDLYYSKGRLVNPRYEEFEEACEARKQDVDRLLNKMIRELG